MASPALTLVSRLYLCGTMKQNPDQGRRGGARKEVLADEAAARNN